MPKSTPNRRIVSPEKRSGKRTPVKSNTINEVSVQLRRSLFLERVGNQTDENDSCSEENDHEHKKLTEVTPRNLKSSENVVSRKLTPRSKNLVSSPKVEKSPQSPHVLRQKIKREESSREEIECENKPATRLTPRKLKYATKESSSEVKDSENKTVTPLKLKYAAKESSMKENGHENKTAPRVTPRKLKFATNKLLEKRTPRSKSTTSSKVGETQGSPYVLRQKIKKELTSLKALHIESDPEDSDENSFSDRNESENDTAEEETSSPKKKKSEMITKNFSETYFFAQKQKKSVTSNRTLSNLNIKRTDITELQEILKNAPEYHTKQREMLFKYYCSNFEKWLLLMKEGFNILLYGVGSKFKILNEFCKSCLEESLYITVNGFFPSLNVKQILNTITEDALACDSKFSNISEQAEYIKKHFSSGKEELYLVFHNIDGMQLRKVKTQAILSSLAAVSGIHFISSVDHINSPLIWNQVMLSQFKWVWFDTTTFEPYVLETSYQNSIFKDQSSHLLLSSLLHVYNSLTTNSQGVFLILARYQQEQQNKANSGMTFHEWYQECREAFLVNSEITMQAVISEFKNHKLLTSRKSIEGIELWYIPVDSLTLEQFLENCE